MCLFDYLRFIFCCDCEKSEKISDVRVYNKYTQDTTYYQRFKTDLT